MKDLSIEEKAKAYDEALSVARETYTTQPMCREQLSKMFPELKESEDDIIIAALKSGINGLLKKEYHLKGIGGISFDRIIAWLEAQGDKDKLIKELGKYKVKYTQEVLEKQIKSISHKDNERLRKTTISFLKHFADKGYENAVECIDWIEAQWEENLDNSAENSEKVLECVTEENEEMIDAVIADIQFTQKARNHDVNQVVYESEIDWLKSLKNRVLSQTKHEWSEDDEKAINDIMWIIEVYRENGFNETHKQMANNAEKWLKSLRPQITVTDEELIKARNEAYNDALDKLEYHSDTPTFNDGWSAAIWYLKKRNAQFNNAWKPSDEQMEGLHWVLEFCNTSYHTNVLKELVEQLKKLRDKV